MRGVALLVLALALAAAVEAGGKGHGGKEHGGKKEPKKRRPHKMSEEERAELRELRQAQFADIDADLREQALQTILKYSEASDLSDPKVVSRPILVKTHKTASSTLFNILVRFAAQHDLRVWMPIKGNDTYNQRYGIVNTLYRIEPYHTRKDVIDVHANLNRPTAQVWTLHTRYAPDFLRMFVPDGQILTSVRDPTARFISWWNFANLEAVLKMTLPTFLKRVETVLRQQKTGKYQKENFDEQLMKHINLLTYELTAKNYRLKPVRMVQTLEDTLRDIEDLTLFVVVQERFMESLAVLKHTFGWTVRELFVKSKKMGSGSGATVHPGLLERIRTLHDTDQQIYDASVRALDKRVAQIGKSKVEATMREIEELSDAMQVYCDNVERRYHGGNCICKALELTDQQFIGKYYRTFDWTPGILAGTNPDYYSSLWDTNGKDACKVREPQKVI